MKHTKQAEIILKLNFEDYENCLWSTGSKNFMHKRDQKGRFVFMEGSKQLKGNYLYFCETYLEAKVWQAVLAQKYGVASALYSDECAGSCPFVVLAMKEVNKIKGSGK